MMQINFLGQALAACSSEPIHIPGAIQPFGILFTIEDGSFAVSDCSLNVESDLGVNSRDLLGRPITDIISASELISHFHEGEYAAGEPIRVVTGSSNRNRDWDVFVHRHRGKLILEMESVLKGPAVKSDDVYAELRASIARIQSSNSLIDLCQKGCEGVKALTGFDGIMVYRFHSDEHGEVIAEAKSEGFPKYLGLHYPASDIPRQAREMFLQNWVRMIPDRDYVPVPLVSALDRRNGASLDLGRSLLRSVSPIHIEYLKNMGVRASLTISLIREGKLWGLIAGHHYQSAKHIPFIARAASETLGRLISTQLSHISDLETRDYRGRAKAIHNELSSHVREGGGAMSPMHWSAVGRICSIYWMQGAPLLSPRTAHGGRLEILLPLLR